MQSMCLAESAIFLCFHSVRMIFLIFSKIVISLLTFRTCQCDFYAHSFHLHMYFWMVSASLVCVQIWRKKKDLFRRYHNIAYEEVFVNTFLFFITILLYYFSDCCFLNISSIVCQPRTAHFTLAGM